VTPPTTPSKVPLNAPPPAEAFSVHVGDAAVLVFW